ncbi:putative galacturonosyltransferase-like 4 [Canna indica]|uniref:Galacturonosyltransferase-like 4 n=1 Tax=Canna indica TaxID=4628 RepID=A0AAQ3JSU9_9LILI|nr:putative galacturonosyltransferase-like 4 [Canna indica]
MISSLRHHRRGFFSTLLLLLAVVSCATFVSSIRVDVIRSPSNPPSSLPAFHEAPAFRNGDNCTPPSATGRADIVMTLDANYLCGTMAAILSIMQHTSCPERVTFHFLAARPEPEVLANIRAAFPYLNFRVYRFDSCRVRCRISGSIRQALDQPLNYDVHGGHRARRS